MATVLIVGSHPDVTRFVTDTLRAQGWTAVGAVGPEAGFAALKKLPEIDAMVVGGREALAARSRLAARLHEKHPFAQVVVPTSPELVGQDLLRAFGGDAH